MAEAGEVVAPVRIDDRQGRRQLFVGLMVIDDDDIHAELVRFRQRRDAGGAAIDRDEERRALLRQRPHGFDVGAVAFEQPVRNMDQRIEAAMAQKAREQRRRSGAVNIIIAEYGDALAAPDRVRDARRRRRHGGEHVGIGHRALDGRIEEGVDRVDLDIAAGEDARQQLRQIMPLRDRERPRGAALVEPAAPGAPSRRAFDAEEEAGAHGQLA